MLGVWLTAERGTDSGALAAVLGALNTASSSGAISDAKTAMAMIKQLVTAIQTIPTTVMRGTDSAAAASSYTAALATALANYTAIRAGYIDELALEASHRSYLFPDLSSNIDLTCTLTSGAIDTFGTWAEVTDSGPTTFGSLCAAAAQHITALRIKSTSVADVLYVIELGYGPNDGDVTVIGPHDFGSGTKRIDSDEQVRLRMSHVPAGSKLWYRMKTENNLNATATIVLRYHAHA